MIMNKFNIPIYFDENGYVFSYSNVNYHYIWKTITTFGEAYYSNRIGLNPFRIYIEKYNEKK